jgi:cytochrome c-type biogenesis protein CcmE
VDRHEPVTPGRSNRSRRTVRFVVGGIIVVAAAIFLIVSSAGQTTMYYLTVGELLARQETLNPSREVRVGGLVVEDSVSIDLDTRQAVFVMQDKETGKQLKVQYKGGLPDTFRPGSDAMVEGRYSNGVLEATIVLTTCPSKYEPDQ